MSIEVHRINVFFINRLPFSQCVKESVRKVRNKPVVFADCSA